MYFIIFSNWKEKLLLALRVLLVMLVLSLLVPKAVILLLGGQFEGGFSKDEHPSGNPRRVEQTDTTTMKDQEGAPPKQGILDSLVDHLQKFYHKER